MCSNLQFGRTIKSASTRGVLCANGATVEVEEEVAMAALPADVKAGLQADAGEGKLVKVETITKKDKLVAYEAVVTKGGQKLEIQVGPGGKPLDHEE